MELVKATLSMVFQFVLSEVSTFVSSCAELGLRILARMPSNPVLEQHNQGTSVHQARVEGGHVPELKGAFSEYLKEVWGVVYLV